MNENEEKFEIMMRIMGREVLAFSMLSLSNRKNWVSIAVISLVIITLLIEYAIPGLVSLLSAL